MVKKTLKKKVTANLYFIALLFHINWSIHFFIQWPIQFHLNLTSCWGSRYFQFEYSDWDSFRRRCGEASVSLGTSQKPTRAATCIREATSDTCGNHISMHFSVSFLSMKFPDPKYAFYVKECSVLLCCVVRCERVTVLPPLGWNWPTFLVLWFWHRPDFLAQFLNKPGVLLYKLGGPGQPNMTHLTVILWVGFGSESRHAYHGWAYGSDPEPSRLQL